ncbi:hypothetical protein LTR37_012726 [Vermiconidia calcicola]|uniref:Uncharacterized protein n=1 Tax=Vermiconidia calcicola TaxID=1690605 RepID=A0ACC3MYK4_9PEZI|nr:hypothetical protein LTR37_012726 [Vermiconidia calcicola]
MYQIAPPSRLSAVESSDDKIELAKRIPPISLECRGLATALTDLAMQAQQVEDRCQCLTYELKEANDALIRERAAKNELEALQNENQQLEARLEASLMRASQAEAGRIKSFHQLSPLISKAEQLERECKSLQHRLDKADTANYSLRTEKDSVSELLVSVRNGTREAKAARAADIAELKQEIANTTKQNHCLVEEKDRLAKEMTTLEGDKLSVLQQLDTGREKASTLRRDLDVVVAAASRVAAALAQKQSALDTIRNNAKQEKARFENAINGFRPLEAKLKLQAEECSTRLRDELSNHETLTEECCRLRTGVEERAAALQDVLSKNKTLAEKYRNLETQLEEQAARVREGSSNNEALQDECRKLKEESNRVTMMMNFFQQELDKATKLRESQEQDNARLRQSLKEWENMRLSSKVMQPRAFLQGFRRLESTDYGSGACPTMPEPSLEEGDVQDVNGVALTAGAWKPPTRTILEPDDGRVGVSIFAEAEGTMVTLLAEEQAESDYEPGEMTAPSTA